MISSATLSTSGQIGAPVYDWQLYTVRPTIKQLLTKCAREAGLTVDDICGSSRVAPIADARQRFFYLAAQNPRWSWPKISHAACKKCHSTAYHGARAYAKRHGLPMPEARV